MILADFLGGEHVGFPYPCALTYGLILPIRHWSVCMQLHSFVEHKKAANRVAQHCIFHRVHFLTNNQEMLDRGTFLAATFDYNDEF